MGVLSRLKQILRLGSEATTRVKQPSAQPLIAQKVAQSPVAPSDPLHVAEVNAGAPWSAERDALVARTASSAVISHKGRLLHWKPSEMFPIAVKGVSYRRKDIADLARNRPGKPAFAYCTAVLMPEDANPYDQNAVAVLIEGRMVGYLPREYAPEFRAMFQKFGLALQPTTCDAAITHGLDIDGKEYEYVIGLDIAAEQAPADIAPTYPILIRLNPDPRFVRQKDGRYIVTARLDQYALDKIRPNDIYSWTKEDWTTVNYYLSNTYGVGGGYKLFSVPKKKFRELFGDTEPDVEVEAVHGRTFVVSFDPNRLRSKFWEARDKFREMRDATTQVVEREKPNETTNPTQAIAGYRAAVEKILTFPELYPTDSRFDNWLPQEWIPERTDLLPLDRLSLLLLRENQYASLIEAVDTFFDRFPESRLLKVAEPILKRRERAAKAVNDA